MLTWVKENIKETVTVTGQNLGSYSRVQVLRFCSVYFKQLALLQTKVVDHVMRWLFL